MTVTYLVWGITAGLCAATLYLYFIKRTCGSFIKALTDNGCFGAENAKSCEELGIKTPDGYLKKQLEQNGGMSKMVKADENGKYYIPEEYSSLAGKKYRAETIPFIGVLGLIVLIILVGAVASYLLPGILDSLGELF
jgi:hypothetical protein